MQVHSIKSIFILNGWPVCFGMKRIANVEKLKNVSHLPFHRHCSGKIL